MGLFAFQSKEISVPGSVVHLEKDQDVIERSLYWSGTFFLLASTSACPLLDTIRLNKGMILDLVVSF